jgi:myo-inositol-1(or 4)-monophosphatase
MFDRMMVLENVKKWVIEVGEMQRLGLTRQDIGIQNKSTEFDLVTDIDRQSEMLLTGWIKKAYPDHAILAEESGRTSQDSDYLWIIDPLDGTTNYAHGYPVFGISIALQYQGETILGVVYAPVLHEMFQAVKGEGAYCNGKRLKVSSTGELKKALLATGFPYDKAVDPNNNLNYFNRMVPQIVGIRRSGSAAYDLCSVAAGRLDGYWELKLKPWDVAAGILIVRESGGHVIHFEGEKGISLIAAGEKIGGFILAELREVNPELRTIHTPILF